MCGIVGISGSYNKDDLLKAIEHLKHRGPDDDGIYHNDAAKIGLGHTRLSIIDLSSNGHQPMLSQDESIVLVFNGEIYNYQLLRSELIEKNYSFRGESDTEVVLNMYLEYGIECLSHFNGIFSLALYDRNNNDFFIARDGLGVKPLYYYEGDHNFSFSSEIKSLIELIPGQIKIDLESIQRYMTYLWCPGKGTPAKSLSKLLPGELLNVRNGEIIERSIWYQLPQSKYHNKIISSDRAIKIVRKGLADAVDRQMVADVPVGAFLSGGLDSSAIVALAKERSPNLPCFTIEPLGGSDSDITEDLPYARQVADHLKLNLEVVKIDPQRLAADLEEMVWQLDEPLADPAPLNVLYISKLAKERGLKVLLSGAGGDDLFTGYRRHLAIRYEHYWSWLPSNFRQKLEDFSLKFDQSKTFGRRMSKLFNNAAADENQRLVSHFAWSRREDIKSLYSPMMKEVNNFVNADQPILDYLSNIDPRNSSINRMLALEQRFFLGDHNLIYTDKMSMAASVEVRVPFLDLELMEIAASIPDKFKQNGTVGKWVLKKAMEPYLPSNVIYRPKTGFGAPLRRWIRYDLRDKVSDLLSEKSINSRGLFDAKIIKKLINDNDLGHRDATYTIFSLLCIEIWCRKFIDKNS